MSSFPKLKTIHQTRFPGELIDVIIKYFTMPVPSKNILFSILKKLNVFNPQTLPKSSKKSSSSGFSPIIITFLGKPTNESQQLTIPADSPFSAKNLTKSQIESIEKALTSERSYKQKDFKAKNSNRNLSSIYETIGMKNSILDYSNNTEFIYLFRIVNTLIDFYNANNLLSQDFLMAIEPLIPLLYRYLIRLVYQYQNLFQESNVNHDLFSDHLYLTSSLVIETFLKLTSIFDIQSESTPQGQSNTDFDIKSIKFYDLEAFHLLSFLYRPIVLIYQYNYSDSFYEAITPFTLFLRELSQMSLNALIKRNTLLISQTNPTITLFLPYEIYQFLLICCTHGIYYCFNTHFIKAHVNKVISILMSLLKFDKRMSYSAFVENETIGFTLFTPVIDIFNIVLKTLISIPQYEANSEKTDMVENKDSIASFGSFVLKHLISIYNYCEDSADLMDYLKNNSFVELVRDYFEYNLELYADEIITGLDNCFKTGKIQFDEEIDCNDEFPVQSDFSQVADVQLEKSFNFISFPSNEIPDISFGDSLEEYLPSLQIPSFQTKYEELFRLSPSFEKLVHTNVKNQNKSKLLRNVLLMLAPKIVEKYSVRSDDISINTQNAMMIILLVKILIESSVYLNIELIKKHDLFKTFTDLFVFDSIYYPFVKDVNYSHFNPLNLFIFKNARMIIFQYLKENYTNFSYNIIVLILNKIETFPSLEITDLYTVLLKAIYQSNVSQFLRTSIETNCIFPLFIKHSLKLQKLFYQQVEYYLQIKDDNSEKVKGELKFLHAIHQCRINQLLFFLLFAAEPNSNNLFYANSDINTIIFNFLFEKLSTNIALDFIHHGFLFSESQNISKTMNSLLNILNICIDRANNTDQNEDDYLNLALKMLGVLVPSIERNQKVLIEIFISFDFIKFLFTIPSSVLASFSSRSTKEIRMKILNNVFNVISALSFKNHDFRNSLVPQILDLSDLLKQFALNDETIESILKLIFEQPIYLSDLPENVEIRFYQVLKFVYLITEKDYKHRAQFLAFLSKIARNSFLNRFYIYKSHLIRLSIDSITQNHLPKGLSIGEMKDLSESVEAMWEIIKVTFSSLFRPCDLVNIFHNIKQNSRNKTRGWFVSQFMEIFEEILSSSQDSINSSFFHFKGPKHGIYIPRIDLSQQKDETLPTNAIQQNSTSQNGSTQQTASNSDTEKVNASGWTFFCQFRLDEKIQDNACLLSFSSPISSKDYMKLQFVFIKKKMYVVFNSPENESPIKKPVDYYFKSMSLYSFIIKLYKNGTLKIFINGSKIFICPFKNMKFDRVLEHFSVANSYQIPIKINSSYNKINPNDSTIINNILLNLAVERDSALSCDITCCYLFNKSLPKSYIKNLFQLPLDYQYSFTLSNSNMCKNLPQALYTGEIENDLVFCYNAHLGNGKNISTNVKKNGRVGDAIYFGYLIPYNSSIFLTILNFGGPVLLLPLYERIDLPVDHSNDITYHYQKSIGNEEDSVTERKNFFAHLLNVIVLLTQDELAAHVFSHNNGFEALSHFFSKIDPEDWSEAAFVALNKLYKVQKNQNNKMRILQTLILRFSLWSKLSAENHRLFINFFLLDLFSSEQTEAASKFNSYLVERIAFWKILSLILCIPKNEIREMYWDFLVLYARYGLLHSNEKNELFIIALDNRFQIAKRNRLIGQSQALNALYRIVVEKSGDSHQLLINPSFYNQIIFLAESQSEIVRFSGLRFLILINELNNSNQFTKEIPYSIDQAISTYLTLYNPINMTEYTWNELTSMVYNENDNGNFNKKRIVELLSVFASFSSFASLENILKFVQLTHNQLHQSFAPFEPTIPDTFNFCECLTSSPNWIFNLFYIFIQTRNPIRAYNHSNEIYALFIDIFRDLFFYLLLSDKNKQFSDCLNSLMMIQYVLKLDTSFFIQLILSSMVVQIKEFLINQDIKKITKNKYNYMNALTNLISSSFLHLFICNSYEYFYQSKELLVNDTNNIQLNEIYELPNEPIPYSNYLPLFQNKTNIPKINSVFHIRIGDYGNWIDNDLATNLHSLLDTILFVKPNLKLISITVCNSKPIKLIDIYALVDVFLKKCSNNDLSSLHNKLMSYPIKENIQKNENLIALCIAIYKGRYEKYESQNAFNGLVKIIKEYSESNSDASDLNHAIQYSAEKYFEFISNLSKSFPDLSKAFGQISLDINYKPKSIKPIEFEDLSLKYAKIERRLNKTFASITNILDQKYANLRRAILLKSGLYNYPHADPLHWKLSSYLDSEFRHIKMTPNYQFNNHIDASIRRDAGNKNDAEERLKTLQLTENDIEPIETDEEEIENEMIENSKSFKFETEAQMITIQGNFTGTLSISSKEICFNGVVDPITDVYAKSSIDQNKKRHIQISLNTIILIFKRNYKHIESAFEIFISTNHSFFFNLVHNQRKKVFRLLSKQSMPNLKYFQINDDTIDHPNSVFSLYRITERWQKKEISNYQYLILLNLYSGRSFNDLTQYPVFPWILSNYHSETLDLHDPHNYRDLSKPIGALNQSRLKSLKDKIEMAKEFDQDDSPDKLPYFLYTTHYSTAYDVVYYLIRVEPFTSIFIHFQGNKFDLAERTFQSIGQVWDAINSSQAQYKELIPEMFTTPEILMNQDKFDLGKTTPPIQFDSIDYYNDCTDYVQLPPWAHNNPYLFIQKHREALESDYVSMHLNEWIDLIFGFKQTGENAVQADNTFHPYSYSSYLTPQVRKDKEKMKTIQMTIVEFGITPNQIIKTNPHPLRTVVEDIPRRSFKSKKSHNHRSKNQSNNSDYDAEDSDEDELYSIKVSENTSSNLQNKYIVSLNNRKPVYVSGNQNITLVLASDSHLLVYRNYSNAEIKKYNCKYKLLSEYDLSQFITFNDLNNLKFRNCISFFGRLVTVQPKQQMKLMNLFIVTSDKDVSFYIFTINEDDGSVYHLTSFQDHSIISQMISCRSSSSFATVSSDTSITMFSLKCIDKESLFINSPSSSQIFDSLIQNAPVNYDGIKYSVPLPFDKVINLKKVYRIIPHSTKIVDISESMSLDIIVSADINKLILNEMKSGKYLKTITLINSMNMPRLDQENDFYNIAQTIKNILISENAPCIVVATKLKINETFTEISISETDSHIPSDEEEISLSDTYLNNSSFIKNNDGQTTMSSMILLDANISDKDTETNEEEDDQNRNEQDNEQQNEFDEIGAKAEDELEQIVEAFEVEDNTSILDKTKETGHEDEKQDDGYLNEESEINPETRETAQNEEVKVNDNNLETAKPPENANSNDLSKNEKNWQEKNQIKVIQEIITKDVSNPQSSAKKNYPHTSTVFYSFDLSGSLISYLKIDAKIKSWCELEKNSHDQSGLVVAFDNCTICVYSLPFFNSITTFSLMHNAERIYYNKERNTIIVIQEGNEYLVFELNLFD